MFIGLSRRKNVLGLAPRKRVATEWSFASSMTCDNARREFRHELTSEE
jgi:hypothetical protein